MIGAERAAPATFTVGWYGKVPGTGDFITRRVPAAFRDPWDRWLQQALQDSRERLGEHWRDAYLTMPPWRFVLAPGLLGGNAWAGVMVPSVDAVGRYFPLTAAAPLPASGLDLAGTLFAAAPWFDEIEALTLSAVSHEANREAIDAALSRRPFQGGWLQAPLEGSCDATVPMRNASPQMLAITLRARVEREHTPAGVVEASARIAEPAAAWLAEESEVLGRSLLLCEKLPSGELWCAMMDGRWNEHGWGRCDLRGGA